MIDRYLYAEIDNVWSDNNRFLLWAKIELKFLQYFNGDTPRCPDVISDDDVRTIQEIECRTRHDTAAFVEWLEHKTKNRFIHYGLTSSDLVDTAFSMQIRESNEIIINLLAQASTNILALAQKYENIIITGRTHGQAAEPINLYDKFIAYHDALQHHRPHGPYYGKLSGSTGDYKYFTPEVEKATLNDFNLLPTPIKDGQIIHRATFAEYMNQWATLASVIGKIATDIRLLAQSEIQEFQEGTSKGQMGSSSMPQKKNPVLSENICGLTRTIRGYQTTTMQNIELWNERDISHSSAERIIFPDAANLLGFILIRLADIFKNLIVNTENIQRNLDQHKGMDSQAKMLHLIREGCSRTEAHAKLRS